MTLYAAQLYFKEQLNGLQTPNLPEAEAWVLPPPITFPIEHPQIYIWGGSLDENRLTIPRFNGQKRVGHTVNLWAALVTTSDVENDQLFPVFLDAIRKRLRTLPIPAEITDPITGEKSVLQTVGERILQEYGTPMGLTPQGNLLHTAALRAPFGEYFTG